MARKAPTWEDYEYGRFSPRQGSVGSNTSRVQFDDIPDAERLIRSPSNNGLLPSAYEGGVRHRRSSISMRLNSLAQVGGVNSLENFARSWQRATSYRDLVPGPESYEVTDDENIQVEGRPSDEEHPPVLRKSLLSQQLTRQNTLSESERDEAISDTAESPYETHKDQPVVGSPSARSDIFAQAPYLGSPFPSSYDGTYGTLSSRINDSAKRHAAHLYREQQETGIQDPDKERERLLVKRVEQEDGKIVVAIIGQSTIYQTVLNSTNVLIGVGLLSLPLGIKYAGWLMGLLFLSFSALVTAYTAQLLSKCLDLDSSLVTFADIAYISFGPRAQFVVGLLFSFELIAACVALFVLFADSLNALIVGWGVTEFKVLCGVLIAPLSFVPLRFLGYSSSLGIICCLGIVGLVFVDGLIKPHTPGSLREPAATYLFPSDWYTLPLSFGLLMSPWGGHSVFPNIYRDMRHPKKYGKSLRFTFGFTYLLDLSMGVAGLLMFGDGIRDEVTSNIFLIEGYPKSISLIIAACIAIIPLTKIPLNARPIFTTIEKYFGLGARNVPDSSGLVGLSGFTRGLLKCTVRIGTTIVIMIIAILCPSFDRVMAFMGSAFCFTICVVLPIIFYLQLFGKEISMKERILDWILVVICSIMAIVGTIWAFLPKS